MLPLFALTTHVVALLAFEAIPTKAILALPSLCIIKTLPREPSGTLSNDTITFLQRPTARPFSNTTSATARPETDFRNSILAAPSALNSSTVPCVPSQAPPLRQPDL